MRDFFGTLTMKTAVFASLAMVALMSCAVTTRAQDASSPLASLHSTWPTAGLAARYTDDGLQQVEQGGALGLTIAVSQEAYIAIMMVDPKGQAVVVVPHGRDGDGRCYPGTPMIFPDAAEGETFYAAMAPGLGNVVVIASQEALFQPSAEPSLPQPVQQVLATLARTPIGIRSLALTVSDPKPRDFLSPTDVVNYFTVRTRGVKNASLGLRVGFDTNSATLDSTGRRQLESLGRGLSDPQLAGKHFVLEGYTDDRGTDAYNDGLSEHRAQAVRDYLVKEMKVDAVRLKSKGFGKSNPVEPGTSDEARALNRRVVIRRLEPDQ